MSLVSIILPVHNGEEFLKETIESILLQSYKNFELIVVNDRSTDHSLPIIKAFQQRDHRIKLFHNEDGGKLPGTLNAGFKQAQGDYYTWWSDDNIMYPNMLEKMVTILNNHLEYGCVTANFTDIDVLGNVTYKNILNTQKSVLVGNNFCVVFLYRKEVAQQVGLYNTELFLVEDYDFFIRLFLITKRYHIPEILANYRTHPKSLTGKFHSDVRKKDAEIKYNYLNQFKDKICTQDYFDVLWKIIKYHPNKVIGLKTLLSCIIRFPHYIILKIIKKIKG